MLHCLTALSESGIVTGIHGREDLRFAWCTGHIAMEDVADSAGQEDAG